MQKIYSMVCMVAFVMLIINGCRSQNDKSAKQQVDRPPSSAGKFYPGSAGELRSELKELFAEAKPRSVDHLVAIICPHAGYVFSGVVAASSYNQIPPDQEYDNIFIIGSSHYVSFPGASMYPAGDYQTPLGKVKVNTELVEKLIRENPVFTYNPEADKEEHSIEVQVPFLQYHLTKPFSIVPIVLGTQSDESCAKIAQALKPYLNEKNLFVISTDFSHYPAYPDAVAADKRTCDAIITGSPQTLQNELKENERKDIPNLVTSLCGWTSILTLLDMTADDAGLEYTPILYRNSGDSKYADKSRVVGYWSIAVKKKSGLAESPSGFNFTTEEKKVLLGIARTTIKSYINERKRPEIEASGYSGNMKLHAGAFVTLTFHGELRGCIGQFTSDKPLYQLIQDMAIASSTQDPRFEPVSPEEVNRLSIEISVLSPMRKISSPKEIVLGKHGIYIRKGSASGTFLPQVATGTGWNVEEFLGHCARDKAGIGWDGWKTAELYVYEATVFSEKEFTGHKD
jgi:MEMO1 family protein